MRDFLVLGAGALGLLTAREIALSGGTVELVEAGRTGREASWAGGGILSPLRPWEEAAPVLHLWQWSLTRFPALACQLRDETGVDPEWNRCGLLYQMAEENARATGAWYEDHGFLIERLTANADLPPPAIACPDGYGAFLLPEIANIRNPRLLQALKRSLELNRKVLIRENCPVRSLHLQDDRITCAVLENGEQVRAGQFIVTAGAWTPHILEAIPPPLPRIAPIKGQMIALDAKPDWLRHIVYRDGRYLIPRMDGTILAGSTVEQAGFDKSADPQTLDELRNFAVATLPALRNVTVTHHWAGIRPGSPGGIPYIGRHPALRNLFFNCGHFRNGLATSLASARLMADILLRRPPILPAEPYALEADRPVTD